MFNCLPQDDYRTYLPFYGIKVESQNNQLLDSEMRRSCYIFVESRNNPETEAA